MERRHLKINHTKKNEIYLRSKELGALEAREKKNNKRKAKRTTFKLFRITELILFFFFGLGSKNKISNIYSLKHCILKMNQQKKKNKIIFQNYRENGCVLFLSIGKKLKKKK